MEPQAQKLYAETYDKNMIDKDEYSQTAGFEIRCANMLAQPFHAPDVGHATGCGCALGENGEEIHIPPITGT